MYTNPVSYEYKKLSKELENHVYKNLDTDECKELLFKGYIRLAIKIANTFNIPNHTRDEVESEAFVGLWKAVLEFNPDRGFKFSTFATRCIQNHLLKLLNSRKNDLSFLSLDMSITEDGDDDMILYDALDGSRKDYVHDDNCIILRDAIENTLTKEERNMVYLHYYRDISIRKISKIYNTHNTAISRKLNKVRNKLVLYIATGRVSKNVTNDMAFDYINDVRKLMREEG